MGNECCGNCKCFKEKGGDLETTNYLKFGNKRFNEVTTTEEVDVCRLKPQWIQIKPTRWCGAWRKKDV